MAHANYARYYGQVGTGGIVGPDQPGHRRVSSASRGTTPTATSSSRPTKSSPALDQRAGNFTGNYDPANPTAVGTTNTVDPNLKNDITDEFIVGLDREVGAGFAVGAQLHLAQATTTSSSSTRRPRHRRLHRGDLHPGGRARAPTRTNARCPAVTYYQPNFQVPSTVNETNFTNAGSFNRVFNGVELTGRKRMSHHWMMNTSFAYNSTIVNFADFTGASTRRRRPRPRGEDPTNLAGARRLPVRLPDAPAAASATSTSTPSGCSR